MLLNQCVCGCVSEREGEKERGFRVRVWLKPSVGARWRRCGGAQNRRSMQCRRSYLLF